MITSKDSILKFVGQVTKSLSDEITYKSKVSHEGIITKIEATPSCGDFMATTKFIFIDDDDELIYHLYVLLGDRTIYHDSRVWHKLEDGVYSD